MKSRRKFLKEVCPTVAFAFFGISFLDACSTDEAQIETSDNGGDDGLGFLQDGNVYTIDLTSSNFSSLSTIGGWMNGYSLGLQMLFLRVSNDTVNAYSNSCPHNGTRNLWELNGDNFRCNDHGNSYSSNDCSGSSGSLNCYSSLIEGNSLIVTT
jgi:nitrite reductase/ring-hydroxylating ferredoxin subunit|tara:strand:+ start:467 stop:928 length:462 start_codon:yes stop_codon:yes gene_type:complete